MGYNKITNLLGKLDEVDIPKFTSIKWIEMFDQSNGNYDPNKDIRFKTPRVRDDLCDFNATDANLPDNTAPPDGIFYTRNVALKNSAIFFNCILKINNQLIEDAQDLCLIYFILQKILEKQQNLFGIIIQINQIQVI